MRNNSYIYNLKLEHAESLPFFEGISKKPLKKEVKK